MYAVFVKTISTNRWSFEGVFYNLNKIRDLTLIAKQENGPDSVRVFFLDF